MPPPENIGDTDEAGMKKTEPDGVIRFEVENVSALDYDGKYSHEIEVKGVSWRARVYKNSSPRRGLTADLKPMTDQLTQWDVDVEAECTLVNIDDENTVVQKESQRSFRDGTTRIFELHIWDDIIDEEKGFINGNKITIEIRFSILHMKEIRAVSRNDFTDPNDPRHDITLVIEGKKIYASKQLLAAHSPFFNVMFYGDFAEKSKKEIELKDVNREEFINLLHVIYPSNKMITDESAEYLLKLGDRFQIASAMEKVEDYLIIHSLIRPLEKLIIADKYGLCGLTVDCTGKIQDVETFEVIYRSPLYEGFSNYMKGALSDKYEAMGNDLQYTDDDDDFFDYYNAAFVGTRKIDPDGVIRLIVENVSNLDYYGKCFAEVEVNGLPWILNARRIRERLVLDLFTTFNQSREWNVDVEAEYTILNLDRNKDEVFYKEKRFFKGVTVSQIIPMEIILDSKKGFIKNDKITVEVRFWISNMKGIKTIPHFDFIDPNDPRHDVTFVIEGEKIYASKQILAFHSPVFNAMFYGPFTEKDKNEIELNDVNREEFLEMLHVIYPSNKNITVDSAEYLLKLGDRFQIEDVIERVEKFILASNFNIHPHLPGFPNMEKLRIADKYRLYGLMKQSLGYLMTSDQFKNIKESSIYSDLSYATLAALFEKLLEIAK